MECGMGGQPYKTPHFHPRYRQPPPVQLRSDLTASAPVSDVSAPVCWNGHGFLCPLWVWRIKKQTVYHVVLQYSIHRPARSDGSGRWDNGKAAQHLPQDQLQPSSGWKNWLQRWREICATVSVWNGGSQPGALLPRETSVILEVSGSSYALYNNEVWSLNLPKKCNCFCNLFIVRAWNQARLLKGTWQRICWEHLI